MAMSKPRWGKVGVLMVMPLALGGAGLQPAVATPGLAAGSCHSLTNIGILGDLTGAPRAVEP